LDINNLQSNLLKQHWASFFNLSGATLYHIGHHFLPYREPVHSMLGAHFIAQKSHRQNVKFHLTWH